MKVNIFNLVEGVLLPITEVKDDSFSEKLLGEGFGVEPANGKIYAPVSGEVVKIFDSKHAFSIRVSAKVEVLVHIGINTMTVTDGHPFTLYIEEGQWVQAGDLVVEVDLKALDYLEKESTVVCVVTSMEWIDNYHNVSPGTYGVGEPVASFEIMESQPDMAKP